MSGVAMSRLPVILLAFVIITGTSMSAAADTLPASETQDSHTSLLLFHFSDGAERDSPEEHSCIMNVLTGYCTSGNHPWAELVGFGFSTGDPVAGDLQVVVRGVDTGNAVGFTCRMLMVSMWHDLSCSSFGIRGPRPSGEPMVHECFAAPYGTIDPTRPADEGQAGFLATPGSVTCHVSFSSADEPVGTPG